MTPTPADIREQLRAATRVQHAVLGQAPDDCIIVRATARWSHVQQAASIDLQLSSLTSLAAARAFAERLGLTADDVADEHERLGCYRYWWAGTYAELAVEVILYTHETDPVTIPAPVAVVAGAVSPLDVAAAIARHRPLQPGRFAVSADDRDTDAEADDIIRRANEIGVVVITQQNVALMRDMLAGRAR